MKKGNKKFTVHYSGTYFDGGRIYGQRVVFAPDKESAERKVQDCFDKRDDEPIMGVSSVEKWRAGETAGSEIYPYWN